MLMRRLFLRAGRSHGLAQSFVAHPQPFQRQRYATAHTDTLNGDSVDLPRDGAPAASPLTFQDDAYPATSSQSVESQDFLDTGTGIIAEEVRLHKPARAVEETWDEVVNNYRSLQHQKNVTGHLGSEVEPYYDPRDLLQNPPTASEVTLELLLASQTHLGHVTSIWHPGNAQYIFGVRDGTHIISLDVTAAHLRRAAKVVEGVAYRGGLILFAGTRKGQDLCVVRAAELAGGCHLFEKWRPGSITNGAALLGRGGTKVVNERDEEVPGFDEQLQKRGSLKPDLVVCLNPMENYVLLHECALNNIPTIGVIDTNANPTWVTYPIPANDDSLRSVQLVAGVLGRAGETGNNHRLQQARRGNVTFTPAQGLSVSKAATKSRASPRQTRDLVPDVVVQ